MAWSPILTDAFTGTNGAPLDTSKWEDVSTGTAGTSIDANRAEFEYADVGQDNARLIVLDGSAADLQVSDCRAEYLVTLPSDLGLEPSTAGLFSCALRTDGLWRSGTTHDPNNGYAFFVSVDDTSGAISGGMFKEVNGVFTGLGADFQIDDGSGGVTQLLVRVEALGDQVRMIARDAALGALPDDTWDDTATDATFSSGQAQMSARGPTGGGSPDRFLWIDDITFFENVPDDMLLSATPAATDQVNLSWTNPPSTASVEVYRRDPPTMQVASDDYTGTNGNPWNTNKWTDASVGTGATLITGNRGEMVVGDVGSDDARVILLDGSGGSLSLGNVRAEFTVELPFLGALPANDPVFGFGVNLRTDGLFAPVVEHDPNNGYRYIAYRDDDANDSINYAIFRVVDGAAVELPGSITVPASSIGTIRMRVEAVGNNLRLVARDAAAGALPDTWDIETTDDTFDSGIVTISCRGPVGGSQPDRSAFIDDFVCLAADFELLNTLGAVEVYEDGPASGLVANTPYDYRVIARDAVPAQIGQGDDSATTLAAAASGPLLAGRRNYLVLS